MISFASLHLEDVFSLMHEYSASSGVAMGDHNSPLRFFFQEGWHV